MKDLIPASPLPRRHRSLQVRRPTQTAQLNEIFPVIDRACPTTGSDRGSLRAHDLTLIVIRAHLEQLGKERDTVVVSSTQTMHTYQPILRLLPDSLQLAAPMKDLEKELVRAALRHVQSNKTLYIVVDDAHLLDVGILRKLRLLFERFPKRHNLVLLGHPELLHRLSLMCNEDIKSRISYSKQLLPLSDAQLSAFIVAELAEVGLGAHTFDEAALQVIQRAVQGNLRLTRNLCYARLVAACLDRQRIVTVSQVNTALLQPHWRSHEALLKQQAKAELGRP